MPRRPKPKRHVVVLSLGAGIQSTALALMLERDLLPGFPKPEWAIFSDTFAEPEHVYRTLDWLAPLISFPIVTTSFGDLSANTWKALRGEPVPERGHTQGGYIDLPIFSETGMARRQCTTAYKIQPIRLKIKELAGARPPALTCLQYIGISTNERKRAKPSRERWIQNSYPLVEAGWSRQDCLDFLDREYPGHPVKRSACYFCPFHSAREWVELAELYPELYQDAVAMERAMADHPRGPWYLKDGGMERAVEERRLQPAML